MPAPSNATGGTAAAFTSITDCTGSKGIAGQILSSTGTALRWILDCRGTVTSVATGTGLTGGPITATGTIALANTAVAAGSYTYGAFTVDAQGRLTAASSGVNPVTSVTAGTGLSGGTITSTGTIDLANTAVTAGSYTYTALTVDAQGRLTAASSGVSPVTSVTAGTGLTGGTITDTGTIALASTTVTAGSYTNTSVTVDAQGRLTAASSGPDPLTAITGTAPVAVTSGATPVVSIASSSTTALGAVQLSSALNSTSETLALTACAGKCLQDQITSLAVAPGIEFAGTIDATTGFVLSITSVGSAAGYTVGSVLPNASATTVNTYVIVTTPGTFTPPGGVSTVATDGDWFLVSQVTPGVYAWNFLNVGFDAPSATTSVAGIVCLSTDALAQAGTDATTALTPAAGASAYVAKSALSAKGAILGASAACTPSALTVGTDGQMLVACSTATTGLCWVNQPAAAIPCATITGKGAIVTGTAASTPTALDVGTNGQVLAVDSNCTSGLKWSTITQCTGTVTSVEAGTGLTGGTITGAGTIALNTACVIQPTVIAAKGDIIVGTAANTPASLTAGTTGQALIVDSTCTSGLKWATLTQCTGTVTSVAAGTGLTGGTITGTGTIALDTACVIQPSVIAAKGDIITGTGANTPSALTVGTNGQFLVACSTAASGLCWATVPSVTSFSGGTTGLTPATAASGAVTLGGTLAIANGGTGATSASTALTALGAMPLAGGTFTGPVVFQTGQTFPNPSSATPPATPATGSLWYDTNAPATLKVYNGTAWVPTASAASSNTAPTSPTTGTTWYDTSVTPALFKVWNGSAWVPVPNAATSTAPTSPTTGQLWNDTNSTPAVLKTWNGSAWVPQSTSVGTTAPSSPVAGQLWSDTNSTPAVAKVWNGTAWVPQSTTVGTTAPSSPVTGQQWNDTTSTPAVAKVWNGTAWVPQSTTVGTTAPSGPVTGQLWNDTNTTPATLKTWNGTAWVASDATPVATPTAFGTIKGTVDNALFNSSLGCNALNTTATGTCNTAIGTNSQRAVTTGLRNTAVGMNALCSVTTGGENTVVGTTAGRNISTGCCNTLIGTAAAFQGTGDLNTAVGFGSGAALLTGSNNISLGYNAGGVTDGCFNVAIGQLVCVASASGSCQLAIGFAAGQNWLTGTSTKAIKPGAGIIDCANSCGTAGQALLSTGSNSVCWGTLSPPVATPTTFGTIKGTTDNTSQNTSVGCNSFNLTATGIRNTSVGYGSLSATTTGRLNTAVGGDAGLGVTTGAENTLVGWGAGRALTTGNCNTLLGMGAAGYSNGDLNVAVGFGAGVDLSTGSNNILIGFNTGGVSTGGLNVAIGYRASVASGTGSCQLAIGFSPTDNWLTGTSTKAIKPGAGIIDCAGSCGTAGQALLSTGSNGVCWGTVGGSPATPTTFGTVKGNVNNLCRNVSLGCNAFNVTGTGDDNTAVGNSALVSATTGFRNVAVGSNTLCSLTTGAQNIAIGMQAGQSITTGIDNVIVGSFSGNAQTTGNQNTFVGSMINFMVTTTGCNNTSIGFQSGGFTTGSCNLAIGFQTSVANAAGSCQMSIGFAAGCWWLRGTSTRAIQPGAGIIDCAGSCGTAGQVLMSNGANAICWGTAGGGGSGIPCACITGQGALVTGTAASTPVALAVGTAGQVLTVDLTCTSGLKWATPSTPSAATPTVEGIVLGRTNATNVGLGCNALLSNTTGTNNTALGLNAGCAITTGSCNVAIGNGVQVASATGNCQLAIGYSSTCNWLTGCSDKTIRPAAGILDCTGSAGVAPDGANTFCVLVSQGAAGVQWSGIPRAKLDYPGTAFQCVTNGLAIGYQAGIIAFQDPTLFPSNYSLVAGNNAAYLAGSVACSTILGTFALSSTGPGESVTCSTVIGTYAMCSHTGDTCLNTVVGFTAGRQVVSSCNTVLGSCAMSALAYTGVNNTVIGFNAQPAAGNSSNTITLGNSSITTIRAQVTSITALSDARDKTDITALPVGLDFVNSLNPVKFTWQMREPNEVKDGTSEAGFIAQDLQVAQETAGADFLGLVYDADPNKLEASAGKLIPVLVKAIQELSAKVQELEARQSC